MLLTTTEIPVSTKIKLLKERFPVHYASFFSRIYKNTERFGEWRLAHLFAATAAIYITNRERDARLFQYESRDTLQMLRDAALWAYRWLEAGTACFFCEPEFLQACVDTTTPKDLQLAELKLPLEGMTFIFPPGQVRLGKTECTFIGFARYTVEDVAKYTKQYTPGSSTIFGANLPERKEDTFVLAAQLTNWNFVSIQLTLEDFQTILSGGLGKFVERGSRIVVGSKDMVNMIESLLHLALNLILAMEAEPALLERERRIHTHKKDKAREVWQPNVLGRRFRVLYTGGVAPGDHASPRMHWRRGHYRQQGVGQRVNICRCGHERALHSKESEIPAFCMKPGCVCQQYQVATPFREYKRIWIPRIFVNGKEAA